jgi:acyl-CoA reductase-like NAD-dependent aldehyde dehydrogenase
MEPREFGLYINGEWRPSSDGRTYQRMNPADGELAGTFALATEDDVDDAARAAREAFDNGPWRRLSPIDRAQVVYKLADLMRENIDEMAEIECAQSGATISQARNFVAFNADIFSYYAGLARDIGGRSFVLGEDAPVTMGVTLREPIGVCALIPPWNFPLGHVTWKVAPALVTGCTMIIKPAFWTPGTALLLADLLAEAGLPPGVYNVLTGPGGQVGDRLIGRPEVNKVSLTGSTATGQLIMKRAAESIKRVTLELGGKSPNVIFADADLEAAVEGAISGAFYRAGQVCNSGSRILIEKSAHGAFMERFMERTTELRIDHPLAEGVYYGPLISEAQAETVSSYLEIGAGEGAVPVLEGGRLSGGVYDKGPYFAPTIFDQVSPDMRIFKEEIFGPVVSVTTFEDDDEAIDMANDVIYGLAAGLWTKDIDRALHVMRGIRAGTVWVNTFNQLNLELPFGGYKESGFGRELGREALDAYTELKSVHFGQPGFAWQGAPVEGD